MTTQSKNKELFSPSALEKLQSPEQLDQLMKITNNTGWLALIGVGLILIVILIWSFFGTIPTRVSGEGILIKKEGLFVIPTLESGRVEKILVSVGDNVQENDLIARISLPDLVDEVSDARQRLKQLERQTQMDDDFSSSDAASQMQALLGQRRTLRIQDSSLGQQKTFLEGRVRSRKRLLEDGLITEQQLFETQQELDQVEADLESNSNDRQNLRARIVELEQQMEVAAVVRQATLEDARRTLAELEGRLERNSQVRSPYSGRIVEISSSVGSLVPSAAPVASLEVKGAVLEALIYVSPFDGKKVTSDMMVNIAPSTVKQEEYGMMIGRVTAVSEYPSTAASMLAVLGNEQLVSVFSKDGPPIAVHAELQLDPSTQSGFAWTSGRGPPLSITGGTVVKGNVTTVERKPIELLIPFIRSLLGG